MHGQFIRLSMGTDVVMKGGRWDFFAFLPSSILVGKVANKSAIFM